MRRGIPPDLLQMWEEEEAAVKAKHGEPVAPKPEERLFNDLLWDHQWYMVRERPAWLNRISNFYRIPGCLTLTDKSVELSIRLVIEATRISQPEAVSLRLIHTYIMN